MKIYDISMSIYHDMPVYKGRTSKRPIIKIDSDFTSGTVYETRLEMNMHTGTHIDAPLHIFEEGSTIDELPLENVVTECKVFDFKYVEEKISEKQLASKSIEEGDFIILKTKNSYDDGLLENEFIYLDYSGACYLKERKVKGVGIDSLGIERGQAEHDTHKILLGAGIIILEGLRLKDIDEGKYILCAPPVKLAGSEAAPARAILIEK